MIPDFDACIHEWSESNFPEYFLLKEWVDEKRCVHAEILGGRGWGGGEGEGIHFFSFNYLM